MKKRWLLLALIAGTFTAVAVLLWLARPLWRVKLLGKLSGFTQDGRELLSHWPSYYNDGVCHSPDGVGFVRYDTRSGRLLETVTVPLPKDTF